MERPSAEMAARVETLVGRARGWRRVTSGYAPTERWVVELRDGGSVFAKAGVTPSTRDALRAEHPNLIHLAATDLVPRVVGWEDGDVPVLVLEDLSRAYWPPPWTPESIERVRDLLGRVAATPPPPGLRDAADLKAGLVGWPTVAADPSALLSLGVTSAAWLDEALPVLIEAEAAARFDGDALVHLDVRSDNLCFAGDRTVLVDWNHASVGNARLDPAFFAPSLTIDGGPEPDAFCDDEPELAALFAGTMALGLGRPVEPGLEKIPALREAAVRAALPWAARLLGLPAPG